MGSPHITSWEIPGSDGQPIYGNTHTPIECTYYEPIRPVGQLICVHGFKGYKDYGFIPLLCERAAQSGLISHRFNFSHSGMTDEIESFAKPRLFQEDTWAKQIADLKSVLDQTDTSRGWIDPIPTTLFGHSRGGVTSLLTVARYFNQAFYDTPTRRGWFPTREDILFAALITAAAPDYACNLDELAKEQLRAEGRLLSPSGRTGQDLYVERGWLDEIERDPELYDPALAAAHVKCPTLIIHGNADTTVPVECAHNLHRHATPNSTLEIIDGASHTFNCPNPLAIDTPWEQVPEATRRLIDLTVDFAVEQCKASRSDSGSGT